MTFRSDALNSVSVEKRRTQGGSSLIEFALAFTLMMMLAVGAVSFGLAIQSSIIVADAANSGALFGANDTFNATYTTGMQQVALIAGAGAKNLTSAASYFCACTPGGSVVTCSSACGSDQPLYYVQVTTSATFNNFFNYAGLPSTFTLRSTSIMPVQ